MASSTNPGIFPFVDFDWPNPIQEEHGKKARKLHDVVQNRTWIKEMGAGPACTWIFWLEDYAALKKLLRNDEDEVAKAYRDFFAQMPVVAEKIREEVVFVEGR
jgi:hypothetical protein